MGVGRCLLLGLWSVAWLLLSPGVQAAAPSYVYDDAGRLLAVIEPSGDAAVYHYDAVGNLLAIDRHAASQLSLLNFTPKSGPVGTTVTIAGTGFDSTPSQNTVTVNGTAAAVTSATPTQLVVSVPSGATSGVIGVTTPSGSTTSVDVFTVTAAGAPTTPPAITSFTPTIGAPGTSVTITGANFSPTPTENHVLVAGTDASVTAATPTTVTATVSSVRASGRITVATVAGMAVSSDDFFIPPGSYTAADVGFTTRVAIGQSQAISLTANKIALVVFDGVAGQRVSLSTQNSTFGSATIGVTVRDPYGILLKDTSISGATSFVEPFPLPVTGSYTLMLDPAGSAAGSLTLTLYDVPEDVFSAIAPDGPPVTLTTTVPGQNAALNFEGTAGQRVSLHLTDPNYGGGAVCVNIFDPIATNVGSQCLTSTTFYFFEPVTLPVTGTYTIFLNPTGAATGTGTYTLYNVPPDVTDTIMPGGAAVTATLVSPGQNAFLSFTGAIGQHIGILINASTIAACTTGVFRLWKPDGSWLLTSGGPCAGKFFDLPSLSLTGTYTIELNPSGANLGQATVTVYDVVDVTGSITPGGSAVTTTIPSPFQVALLAFSGVAGQRVSLLVNSATFPQCGAVRILKPDGSTLASGSGCTNTFLDAQTLPVTGTYHVQIDPAQADTGQSTVTLYDVPADGTGTLALNDPAVTITITVPGQNGRVSFDGTAGQLVTPRFTNNTIGSVTVRLLKPDGTQMISSLSGSATFNMPQQTLPTTGTYTVVVDPSGVRTGSIGVQVTNP